MIEQETQRQTGSRSSFVRFFRTGTALERQDVIDTHTRLMRNRRALIAHRDDLRHQLQDLSDGQLEDAGFLSWIRRAPAPVRARIATRTAARTIQTAGREKSTPDLILSDELAFVESRLRFVEVQLKKLEDQVLSYKPINASDVKTVMQFVNAVASSGRRFGRRQIAEIEAQCANIAFAPTLQRRMLRRDGEVF